MVKQGGTRASRFPGGMDVQTGGVGECFCGKAVPLARCGTEGCNGEKKNDEAGLSVHQTACLIAV